MHHPSGEFFLVCPSYESQVEEDGTRIWQYKCIVGTLATPSNLYTNMARNVHRYSSLSPNLEWSFWWRKHVTLKRSPFLDRSYKRMLHLHTWENVDAITGYVLSFSIWCMHYVRYLMSGPWGKVPWLHNIGDILMKVAKQFFSDLFTSFWFIYTSKHFKFIFL
jgi:hypothetical protein